MENQNLFITPVNTLLLSNDPSAVEKQFGSSKEVVSELKIIFENKFPLLQGKVIGGDLDSLSDKSNGLHPAGRMECTISGLHTVTRTQVNDMVFKIYILNNGAISISVEPQQDNMFHSNSKLLNKILGDALTGKDVKTIGKIEGTRRLMNMNTALEVFELFLGEFN